MGEKISLDGMNVRGNLAKVSLDYPLSAGQFTSDFLRLLTQNRVNMSLLITEEWQERGDTTCCVPGADVENIRGYMSSSPELKRLTEFVEPVALVSIFPHRSNMRSLGLTLVAFARTNIFLYGFCSSLSAVTFMIDHNQLEEAFTALESFFDFPGERTRKPQT
ncbi:MAG: hypothetical protein JW836_13710 [Deltaproteobacteria bacterium]|nr:hypothetical protein [Deltaproteobacteria bacterium]